MVINAPEFFPSSVGLSFFFLIKKSVLMGSLCGSKGGKETFLGTRQDSFCNTANFENAKVCVCGVCCVCWYIKSKARCATFTHNFCWWKTIGLKCLEFQQTQVRS